MMMELTTANQYSDENILQSRSRATNIFNLCIWKLNFSSQLVLIFCPLKWEDKLSSTHMQKAA